MANPAPSPTAAQAPPTDAVNAAGSASAAALARVAGQQPSRARRAPRPSHRNPPADLAREAGGESRRRRLWTAEVRPQSRALRGLTTLLAMLPSRGGAPAEGHERRQTDRLATRGDAQEAAHRSTRQPHALRFAVDGLERAIGPSERLPATTPACPKSPKVRRRSPSSRETGQRCICRVASRERPHYKPSRRSVAQPG